jgi:Protein of unknown function (DUF4239)
MTTESLLGRLSKKRRKEAQAGRQPSCDPFRHLELLYWLGAFDRKFRESGNARLEISYHRTPDMVTVTQNAIVVAITVLFSLLATICLNRIWPNENRRKYNDLIGWQLSILGTTYAVILGFMLYTVWTKFGEAELNVDLEANAVVNIYRLADALPEDQRTQLRTLARSYVDSVLNQEWPQMARGEIPQQGSAISREMWKTLTSAKTTSPTEANAQEQTMDQLESLAQHRLTRIHQSMESLPDVLWWVLLVGGSLTIFSVCTFGSQSIKLQLLQVFSFSLLVSLSLVAIADIHRPFYGLVHVSDYAFQRAHVSMQAQ